MFSRIYVNGLDAFCVNGYDNIKVCCFISILYVLIRRYAGVFFSEMSLSRLGVVFYGRFFLKIFFIGFIFNFRGSKTNVHGNRRSKLKVCFNTRPMRFCVTTDFIDYRRTPPANRTRVRVRRS